MPTIPLLDRSQTDDESDVTAARAHLAEAEEHAGQAAAAAAQAAEHYGALAGRAAQRAADTLGHRVSDTATSLRDEAEELWDDPETRRLALQAAGGVAVVGLAVWLWRRRKRRKQEEELAYEASAAGVPGWSDPEVAFAEARSRS